MSLAPLNIGHVVQGDALRLPVRPGSVSLVVSSPPYWALRAYEDAGEFYDGQLGSEPDPVQFLRNLWASMDEAWDALRDDGVAWINLGDKYAGSGGHNNSGVAPSEKNRPSQVEAMRQRRAGEPDTRRRVATGLVGERTAKATTSPAVKSAANASRTPFRSASAAAARDAARDALDVPAAARASRHKVVGRTGPDTRDRARATRRQAPDRYEQGTGWARAKSLMGLPWAFALGLANPSLYRDHLDQPKQCRTCKGAGVVPTGLSIIECPGACAGFPLVRIPHPQWVWRAEHFGEDPGYLVWDKPNGLPESVTDRPRRTHEVWLLLTKNGRYYGNVDPIREPYSKDAHDPGEKAWGDDTYETWGLNGSQSLTNTAGTRTPPDSRGKPPGSVWRIAAEPFVDDLHHLVDDGMRVVDAAELAHLNRGRGDLPPVEDLGMFAELGMAEHDTLRPPLLATVPAEHFAPFPTEWPRRLILGWSPEGICTACDTGRFPVVAKRLHQLRDAYDAHRPGRHDSTDDGMRDNGYTGTGKVVAQTETTLLGHACRCTPVTDHGPAGSAWGTDAGGSRRATANGAQSNFTERPSRYEYHFDGWEPPPTRPSVVVDMFGGTGTVALVASVVGRVGVSIDLSWTYTRLAQWRTRNAKHRAKVRRRTDTEGQTDLLFDEVEAIAALARDVAQPVHVHTRANAPTTSKRAAVNVMPRAGTQKVKVLATLADAEPVGLTGDELCHLLGDKNGSSWRSRLASLREDYDPPLVVRTDTERTTRSGELAFVHRITDDGRKVLGALA